MMRLKFPSVLLLFISAATCAMLSAQSNSSVPVQAAQAGGEQAASPPASGPEPYPSLFATGSTKTPYLRSIRVVPAEEMSRHDRDLEAGAESSIQERAGFQSLGFNEGDWTFQQLDCPALPNHLFLRFSRNDGTREMSMFSAAIPRNGEGKVRVIPILRKGYSLFSPAPIGALTISAFNHIRAEENNDIPADWLGTGLCYAALAGASPQAGQLPVGSPEILQLPGTIPPTLNVTKDGGGIVRFADLSTAPHPMEWNMTFDSKGKLVKASHAPAHVVPYQPHVVRTLEINDVTPGGAK
jgi:hypothetical protein